MLKILESLILKGFQGFKGFEHKKYPFCTSRSIKRNGTGNGKQRYQCKACLKRFDGGRRLNPDQLWRIYTDGKQTPQRTCRTLPLQPQNHQPPSQKSYRKKPVCRPRCRQPHHGYHLSNQALSVDEVKYETNALYLEAVCKLEQKAITIQSIITCDGRQGLMQMFPNIPIQLCQFHQLKTINRYLTRRPKTAAARDLKAIVRTLKNSTRRQFESALTCWLNRHKHFLNERTVNLETGKSHYTHKRLRSAFQSLKRNLNYLFTFKQFAELNIPQTSNLLEGRFSDMKRKLRCHQGMKKDNKIRFIKDYFSIRQPE